MTEERRERKGYYEQTNPEKRRKILEQAIQDQIDLEENELRKEIWKRRYSAPRRRQDSYMDGYLRLWIELKSLVENPPGRFRIKKEQRNLENELEKLGFYDFYGRGEQARQLLYQECLNVSRVYVQLCFSDRKYSSAVLGMMQMAKEKVQNKIVSDLRGIYRDLPGIMEIPEPLNLLLEAAKETEEELSKRFIEEE